MVLSDANLRAIWPYSNPGPASIDLHIGDVLRFWPAAIRRDPRTDQSDTWIDELFFERDGPPYWVLQSGLRYLAATRERIRIPNDCAGQITARSSWARDGLDIIQGPAGWIDPGFVGVIVLELSVTGSELVLWPGAGIAQLILHRLETPCERPYSGRYQNQDGATPSRTHLELAR